MHLTFTIVLLALCLTTGLAFRCYTCSGPLGKDLACENRIQDEAKPECEGGKVCGQYVIESPGASVLTRECTVQEICTNLNHKYENNPEVSVAWCETCSEDLCNADKPGNSAKSIPYSIMTTVITLSLIWLNVH